MGNSTLPLGGGDTRRLSEIILQPGHTFVAGDVIRADDTTPGEYVLAQADNAANAEAVGIVETIAGTSFEVVYQGRMDLSAVAWSDLPFSAVGEVWFLSDTTAGELTRTPPSTAGTVIKAMLVVTDDTGGSEEGILTGYVGVQIGGENLVSLDDIQPLGTIQPWAAPASTPVPVGWALCNGQELDRTTFDDLFNLIGTDYGVGDGSTTFNIPDFQGRFPLGQEPGGDVDFDDVGETGGEKDHTLTLSEAPAHVHTHDTIATFDPGAGAPYTSLTLPPSGPGPGPLPAGSPEGGGAAHNNMPPFLVINFIIRTTLQARAAILDLDLGDLNDVDVPVSADQPAEPNDGDVLTYNTTINQWEAATPSIGSGGVIIGLGQFTDYGAVNKSTITVQSGTAVSTSGLLMTLSSPLSVVVDTAATSVLSGLIGANNSGVWRGIYLLTDSSGALSPIVVLKEASPTAFVDPSAGDLASLLHDQFVRIGSLFYDNSLFLDTWNFRQFTKDGEWVHYDDLSFAIPTLFVDGTPTIGRRITGPSTTDVNFLPGMLEQAILVGNNTFYQNPFTVVNFTSAASLVNCLDHIPPTSMIAEFQGYVQSDNTALFITHGDATFTTRGGIMLGANATSGSWAGSLGTVVAGVSVARRIRYRYATIGSSGLGTADGSAIYVSGYLDKT